MLQYAKNFSLPKKFFPGSSKDAEEPKQTSNGSSTAASNAPAAPVADPHTTAADSSADSSAEAQSNPPAAATDITTPKVTATSADAETRSPILSQQDEKFFESALESTNDEIPIVIFEGNSEAPSRASSTAPSIKAEVAEDPDPVEQQKKIDEEKKAEWKDAIATKWEGLRRTVSSATSKKRSKSQSKNQGREGTVSEGEEDKVKAKEKEKKEKKEREKKEKEEKEKKEKEEKEKKKKNKGKEKAVAVPEREEDEFTAVLERLNIAAENGTAFSFSAETAALLEKFTQILKDVVNGVPTAYDDLTTLFESSSKQLDETYANLPGFLQKLVKTLPEKLSKNMTPELLRAASTAAPAVAAESSKGGVLRGIPSLKDLITKPGMLMGMLKSVLNVLKTRFPAVLGANVLYSMGLFVILFVLYYCYKRGKEVRLEQEAMQQATAESSRAAEESAREQAETEQIKEAAGASAEATNGEPLIVDPAKDKVA